MVFAIILIVFMLAIVLFHYVQGFFSSALSAIFAVVAAVFAVSYHETVVERLLGGKMADEAHALVLLSLFAVIYLALRIVFDNVASGDVQVPALLNKIGAVVMGVVAAVFATGVVAIAAQELPFGPTVGGYGRHEIADDRPVPVPMASGKKVDSTIIEELVSKQEGAFPADDEHGVPLVPVDDLVIGTVQRMSVDTLSDGKPLASIHPDYLDELFGQRLGIEPGGTHVAMNLPAKKLQAMKVLGLYAGNFPPAAQFDSEFVVVRTGGALKPVLLRPNEMFLVVRVIFFPVASDKDRLVRFSPGSVHLVVPDASPADQGAGYADYFPVGTVQGGGTAAAKLFLNKLDDYLFVSVAAKDNGADLVFKVNARQFAKKAPAGAFIDFKRLARVDLAGMEVHPNLTPDANIDVLRKPEILKNSGAPIPAPGAPAGSSPAAPANPVSPANPAMPAGQPTAQPAQPPAQPAAPAANANAFTVQSAAVSDTLPGPITAPQGANGFGAVPGGTALLAGGKAKSLSVDSSVKEQNAPMKVTQVAVPEGEVMVQVTGTPAASAPWGFATDPDQYELVDSTGKHYQPNGFYAAYESPAGPRLYVRYVDASTIGGGSAPENAATPKQVVLFYLVPTGTTITQFHDHGKQAGSVNVSAK